MSQTKFLNIFKVLDVVNFTHFGRVIKNLHEVGQSDWCMLFWDSHCHFCVQYSSDRITLLLCPSLRHVCPWLNFPFLLMMCSETDPWQDRVTQQCSHTGGLRHLQPVVMAAVWNAGSDRSGECSLDTSLNQLWRVWRFVVYVKCVVGSFVGKFSMFLFLLFRVLKVLYSAIQINLQIQFQI